MNLAADVSTQIHPVTGELRDPSMESAFRDASFQDIKRDILIFTSIAVIATLFFAITETLYTTVDQAYRNLLIGRFVLILAMICTSIGIYRIKKRYHFEYLTFGAIFVLPVAASLITLFRPVNEAGNFIFDIILILAYYQFFNFSFRLMLIPPLVITTLQILFLFAFKDIEGLYQKHVILSGFLIANAIGVISFRQKNINKRTIFLDVEEQKSLVMELEKTIEHAKLLEGVVPICSYCKSVRKDERMWQQIEDFVSSGSNLQFSHSICPECMSQHFPKVDISMESDKN